MLEVFWKAGEDLSNLVKSRLHKKMKENRRRISRYSRKNSSGILVPVVKTRKIKAAKVKATNVKNSRRICLAAVLILVILILFRFINWLNDYSLHTALGTIVKAGLDYDYFRDMKLTEGIYQGINRSYQKNEDKQGEAYAEYAAIYTLLKQNGLLKADEIPKEKLQYLREKLKDNKAMLELKGYYEDIAADLMLFPLDQSGTDTFSFGDTWSELRSYGGNRRHEGTDIFPKENIRGRYEVISATDGVVERLGWLNQGGYRVGIRAPHGAYFYYAHLDSYADGLEVGDNISAGDFLGFMGDSGYGEEGTKGMFPVHLHFGIYEDTEIGELSVNPYGILLYLAP